MLRFKMIEFEAGNARNSRAIAKFSNEEIGHFGLKLIAHVLIRGSLTIQARTDRPEFITQEPFGRHKTACDKPPAMHQNFLSARTN